MTQELRTAYLQFAVDYDPTKTTVDAVAACLEGLLNTALETPGVLAGVGEPTVWGIEVVDDMPDTDVEA